MRIGQLLLPRHASRLFSTRLRQRSRLDLPNDTAADLQHPLNLALNSKSLQPSSTPARRIDNNSHDTYPDSTLLLLFDDLVSVPLPDAPESMHAATYHEDDAILELVDIRIQGQHSSSSISSCSHALPPINLQDPPYKRILVYARNVVSQIVRATSLLSQEPTQQTIPICILTLKEWTALIRTAVRQCDSEAAEEMLQLMQSLTVSPSEDTVNLIMRIYANVGDISRTEPFVAKYLSTPTPEQRHLHVKSHVFSRLRNTYPTSAIALLHSLESQSTPAPMRSYTLVIRALLSTPSVHAHAHAWDLFAHMRYVAHPTPDAYLYAVMIRACPADEPQRALDLWVDLLTTHHQPSRAAYAAVIAACARSGQREYIGEAFRLAREMISAEGLTPDRATFIALLDGAKRLGDLPRVRAVLAEMVKAQVSAEKDEAANPGHEWLNLRTEQEQEENDDRGRQADEVIVDEEVMTHVFNAYAAYKPPYKPSIKANVVSPDVASTKDVNASLGPTNTTVDIKKTTPAAAEEHNHVSLSNAVDEGSTTMVFSRIPPQNHAETLAEASALLERIRADSASIPKLTSTLKDGVPRGQYSRHPPPPLLFHRVVISPRLVNAYLSVHYAHAPTLEQARAAFRSCVESFAASDVTHHKPNNVANPIVPSRPTLSPRGLVEALERCAHARRGPERATARTWAEEELWRAWAPLEDAWLNGRPIFSPISTMVAASPSATSPPPASSPALTHIPRPSISARLIERAHIAMIRILTLNNDIDGALKHMDTFVKRHPPKAVLTAPISGRASLSSTRTSLFGTRPLVRLLGGSAAVARGGVDDSVPPLLSFADLDILHARAVRASRVDAIARVKWVCMSYTGALRKRRAQLLKGQDGEQGVEGSRQDGAQDGVRPEQPVLPLC